VLAWRRVPGGEHGTRILQQLGGVPGTALLALILARAEGTQPGPSAFGHASTWALGLTALGVIPPWPCRDDRDRRPDDRSAGPGEPVALCARTLAPAAYRARTARVPSGRKPAARPMTASTRDAGPSTACASGDGSCNSAR
jgi:hypothetical protein